MKERLKWIIYHPIHEIIYLLCGTPNAQINTLNYRNITSVVKGVRKELSNNTKATL